ncbi:MAG: hypothetical protein ACE5Q6_06175, partial [Dehalococcoidia bacterium]
ATDSDRSGSLIVEQVTPGLADASKDEEIQPLETIPEAEPTVADSSVVPESDPAAVVPSVMPEPDQEPPIQAMPTRSDKTGFRIVESLLAGLILVLLIALVFKWRQARRSADF